MASTSTSSVQKSFKYDVFLSFRGEDTRHNFVSLLYNALERNGIQTYKDDQKIEKGETINTQLMESIEDSRFFIIVFSKDYAGSSWCLDELVKIMECQETSEQTAYPVFYDVEPTEIRNQSGAVKEAFKKHENKEGAGKWRKALNDAGNLAGWESKKTANGDESELIKEVVDDIFKKICSISSSVDGDLVGMETRIEAVLSSLELDADDVRMIDNFVSCHGSSNSSAPKVMVSTSASSDQKNFKYDVFLSFRGEDTRNTFVGHLYKALEQNGIQTYKDDEKIEKGETIDTQLIKSIEDSRFFIIVFSKDYAGSSWCLDELVKIMECRKASEQTAYPVFYDVEPTEIRNQSGGVKEAFKKHENKEAAGKWREALKEAADLAGWESKKTANGVESKLIQIIVDDIFKKISSSDLSIDGKLVGMEIRIKALLSSLELDAPGVRMIGIWGMGGGGKTTLATTIFNQISHQFEGISFVENVREVSKNSLSGLKELQKQILNDIFSDQNITVSSVAGGKNKMVQMMRRKKVLVVLDDVDSTEQLEALAGEPDWFKLGSRVIITTRDKQVLLAHGVKFIDVNLLSPAEAICLLSKYAFKRDIPNEGYEELSKEIVQYADGLPLTIKVLGSLLCGQNVPQWKVTLERLKKIPLKATMEKLELSYNSLEEDYKEIFLDVACLLKGWWKDEAVTALKSCGFFAEVGLRVLEQRSLINISEGGMLGMHDHIEEMGKNIVRRENPKKPEMHSRLWIKEEIKDILATDSGTKAIECITLDGDGLNCKILVKGLTNMKKLRFLHVDAYGLNCDEVDPYLPNALQFLSYRDYPFSSLPKTFQAKHLVGLDMCRSNMVQLWEDGEEKACLKLRFLKVTWSELRTLDLSVAPNLETLILENCFNLVEVHFQVTPNLKELHIYKCDRLEKLHMPAESPELRSLNLDKSSKLSTLHLGKTPKLETLHLDRCTDMVELCMPAESPKLRSLNLDKSSKLTTLHLGKTPNLEKLILQDCNDIEELRMPTECPNLETLELLDCTDLVELSMPAEFPKLVTLDFCRVKLQTLHLGITPNLEKLSLRICTGMVELHMPAEYPKLVDLHLFYLPKLRTLHLGSTPNLEKLLLGHCAEIVELCMLAEFPKLVDLVLYCLELTTHQILQILAKCPKLVNLDLDNLNLTTLHLETTPNLEKLSICNTGMVELHITIECPKLVTLGLRYSNLKSLDLKNCYDLKHLKSLEIISCHLLEKLPEDIGRLQCLEKLIVNNCSSLRDIPNSICEMDHLKCLDLSGCMGIEDLPEEIGHLECLEELDTTGTDINRLPQSIFQLKGLNIRGSTQILEYVMCHNTQIQNNIEDGDGDDDTDDDFKDVDEDFDEDSDGDGDGDDELDYEHARMSIMMMLSSGT